jgi:hypothetical protein
MLDGISECAEGRISGFVVPTPSSDVRDLNGNVRNRGQYSINEDLRVLATVVCTLRAHVYDDSKPQGVRLVEYLDQSVDMGGIAQVHTRIRKMQLQANECLPTRAPVNFTGGRIRERVDGKEPDEAVGVLRHRCGHPIVLCHVSLQSVRLACSRG